MNQSKKFWDELGESNPYYAVGTFDKYRKRNIDESLLAEFFETGRQHVEHIWNRFENRFGVVPSPRRTLDYGCGVGRILVALAGKSGEVVGVDISSNMLHEAARNCTHLGISNVTFQEADGFESNANETFDFIHSFIVFQHIKPQLGHRLIGQITSLLDKGGFGLIHVTFFDPGSLGLKLRTGLYRQFPRLHKLLCAVRGKDAELIPIYEYDLNQVIRILHENGCGELFIEFTDHGQLGAVIYCRKTTDESVRWKKT